MSINPNDISVDYITPDSHVWLLKGVPLEPNYENTILWEAGQDYVNGTVISGETKAQARERQFQWFTIPSTKFNKIESETTTYLREGRKYVRIDKPMKDLIGYNYMIFKNEGDYSYSGTTLQKYENKYWYAFITKLEYLNDRVTLIHYSIDVLQTFMFDYEPMQCFVEREHSATDQIGDNIQPEKLETGDLICGSNYSCLLKDTDTQLFNPFTSQNWITIVAATFSYAWYTNPEQIVLTNGTGQLVNGVYTGVYYNAFENSNATHVYKLNKFLEEVTTQGKESGIISIFMMPEKLCTYGSSADMGVYSESPKSYIWDIPIQKESGLTLKREWEYQYKNDGGPYLTRKARNKKLYTAPFTKLVVYNGCGDVAEYSFERFTTITTFPDNDVVVRFEVKAATSPNPEVVCVPFSYDGVSTNYMHKISITGFPQCAFTIDSYRAWLAQNKYKYGFQLAGGGLMTAAGLITGNALLTLGGTTSFFNTAIQLAGESKQHEILPPQVKGTQTPYISVSDHELGYEAYCFHVRDEYANVIDNFFDLYGYVSNKVKTPNRNVRENWCYCKTVGCRLDGYITGDVDDKICSIYNNGIRFWKNGNNIGRYQTLTNRCVSEI